MTKQFTIGFCVGLLIFIALNLLAAHLASDCGLLAVFGHDICADDIARAGWPLRFYEDGGFAYRHIFNPTALLTDLGLGVLLAYGLGRLFLRNKKTPPG